MDKPKVRIKIGKHVCAVDKKERYFTTLDRATPIDDESLIKYASDDSGNGHSVQLGDLGVLRFAIHAKISADLEGAGGAAVTKKRIRFDASKIMRQKLQEVTFSV